MSFQTGIVIAVCPIVNFLKTSINPKMANSNPKRARVNPLSVAMLSIHSSPIGAIGTKNTGGMSVVVTETAKELGALGHSVDIFTAAGNGHPESIVRLEPNVRLIYLNTEPPEIPKSELFHHLPRIYDTLEAFVTRDGRSYDLVHSHYWLSGRVGNWAGSHWGLPHVITFHTLAVLKTDLGPSKAEPDLRMEWEHRLAHSCSRMLVATSNERKTLIDQWGVPESKVTVVPFGVNMNTLHIGDPVDARNRLGLDTDAVILLFVGRFVSLKGIERLMEAVAAMDASQSLHLLLIGGDGPGAQSTLRLKDLSDHLGIVDKIRFLGSISHSDMVLYYNAADLLVLPSYYESFGLVVLESLACGTPVASTPVGISVSVIQNGKNGRIIEDASPAGIAESLAHVLRWIKSNRMSPRDIRTSISTYAWGNVARAMHHEYVKAIDEHNPNIA